jgi:1-acyl-sn-glycerol-3-phosphate acyltransferase
MNGMTEQPSLLNKIKGSTRLLILTGSTAIHSLAIVAHYPLKRLLPSKLSDKIAHQGIFKWAEHWTLVNNLFMNRLPDIKFDIDLPSEVRYDGNYFIIANHQTWVDIVVLQYAFYKRTTFVRFFTKQELAYVPFLGLALYVMDFPYMKRYSKETLAKHPELQGKDIETTKESCSKIKRHPFAILNFLEGTRLTPKKHQLQQSPYQYLLKPKSGGMAFALKALGNDVQQLIDVTVHYPEGAPRFIDFWSGQTKTVVIKGQIRPIPQGFSEGDYENNAAFREKFQAWVNQIWQEKDEELAKLHQQYATNNPQS